MAVATLATMVARYKPHMLFNMSSRAASATVDPGSVLWLHQRQERHQLQRIDTSTIRYPFVASSNQSNRRSRHSKNHFPQQAPFALHFVLVRDHTPHQRGTRSSRARAGVKQIWERRTRGYRGIKVPAAVTGSPLSRGSGLGSHGPPICRRKPA